MDDCRMTNKFERPDYYERFMPLELPETLTPFIYANAGTMNHRVAGDSPYNVFCAYNSEVVADDVIVVGDDATRRYVLVGATTAMRSLTHLSAVWRGRLFRGVRVWQPEISEGAEPEKIVIWEGDDWRDLLRRYGDEVAREMKAAPPPPGAANLTGYCSWYYYYDDVTEKDFLENVATLAGMASSPFKARFVQIDAGYETFQGDWLDRDASWPTPLDEIARRIRAGGMEAGIWTMPFHASTASRVFRDHPGWFVKGPDGKPLVARGWFEPPDDLWATLDTTQEAVLDHLRHVFRTFREWGYTYFKMDGLGFALLDGVRSDPGATSVSAFRLGLRAIREAVPDSFLLACSQHFLPCVGLVDGARFSDDTHASTGPILSAFNQTAARFWMFDRFYWADPDCIIVRTDRGTNTPGESRISALSGIMTGVAITSDNLALVPDDRLALLGRAATLRMRDVKPSMAHANFGRHRWPMEFTGTVEGRPAVALVNLLDQPQTWKIAELDGFCGSVCEELLHPLGKIRGEITLQPRDAALLVQGAG